MSNRGRIFGYSSLSFLMMITCQNGNHWFVASFQMTSFARDGPPDESAAWIQLPFVLRMAIQRRKNQAHLVALIPVATSVDGAGPK
jgi:hypothetical protein